MNLETKIRGAVRSLWMQSDIRRDALKRSRIPCNDGSKRKWLETCEVCGKCATIGEKEHKTKKDGTKSKLKRAVLSVHHIDEVPGVWEPDFLSRMFCRHSDDPVSRLLVVCNECHDNIHSKEKK